MAWLPGKLPENTRFILSSVEHRTLAALRRRESQVKETICGPLEPEDSIAIMHAFLARYRERFDDVQRDALLSKSEAHSPLYLLVALGALRTLSAFEEVTKHIEELPGTVTELFEWILRWLEEYEAFGEDRLVGGQGFIEVALLMPRRADGVLRLDQAGLDVQRRPVRGARLGKALTVLMGDTDPVVVVGSGGGDADGLDILLDGRITPASERARASRRRAAALPGSAATSARYSSMACSKSPSLKAASPRLRCSSAAAMISTHIAVAMISVSIVFLPSHFGR